MTVLSVGRIISLILATVFLVLIILFFASRKNLLPCIVYSVLFLFFLATHVCAWVGVKDMEPAQDVMLIFSICAMVILGTVYGTDIRAVFSKISSKHKKTISVNVSDEEIRAGIKSIVTACQALSKSRTGALIVIVRDKIDSYIIESGVKLDAEISAPLLESIFNTKSPMHDGAVIIQNNRIRTAGSFLPLTKSTIVEKDLGTRHRAGLGVTETNDSDSDIISIIISEETGIISYAQEGKLHRYLTSERLFDVLYAPYTTLPEKKKKQDKLFS